MNLRIGFCGSCISRHSFEKVNNTYEISFTEEIPIYSFLNNEKKTVLSHNELLDEDIILKHNIKKELVKQLNNTQFIVLDVFYDFIYNLSTSEHETIFDSWKKDIENFFNIIQTQYPQIKIILTKIRLLDETKKYNLLIEKLEEHITENYDVLYTNFPSNVTYAENNYTFNKLLSYDENFFENNYYQINSKILETEIEFMHQSSDEKNIYEIFNEINDFKDNMYVYDEFNLLNSIKKDNDALNKKIINQEKEIKQLIKFKEDVYSSLSWKITKPLRLLKKIRK